MTTRAAIPLTIGVTSHRNLVASEVEAIRQGVRDFLVRMRREYPNMPLVVVSALADGGDQLVAEEALAAGARLIAPLPLARAQYASDFTDAAARARFDALCNAAQIIELPQLTDGAVHAPAPTGHERDRHYAQAGVYVSDHCHILLAIWDGKPSTLLGGTAQIVRYRLSAEKPALAERRRAAPRNLLDDDSERLTYQIVCSRDQADGAPAPPLHPLQTVWRCGEQIQPGDGPMPEKFRATLANAAEFNADAEKYSAPIDAHPGLAATAADAGAIERLFRAADWLAIHFQRRVLLAMRGLYTVAALMAIAFTAYDNLPAQDDMLYVFLLLFALGGFLVVLANRRGWHRKYLDCRALAEGLRVQWYWRRIGLSLAGDAEFARDNFLQKQDVELGWVRDAMRSAELESTPLNVADASREMADVVREWVGDAQHGGQLDYYGRKAAQRARTHRITETVDTASLCVGIGISIVLAAFAVHLSADMKNDLVVVMAIFSIVAGVRAAYAYKKADKELIKQYRYMQRIFGAARKALDRAIDAAEQREVLRLLGEAALAEQVEWALMHRQRPLEHNRL
ncbi:MAG TPA: hypothetical protein VL425_11935 [Rudaea sp.]|nr:hypothetical protein [Rudaea sp.]